MNARFSIIPIDALDDPRLGDYAGFRDHELLQRTDPTDPGGHRGLFMAEGELVVRRLLDSSFRAKSVLISSTRLETMRDVFTPPPPAPPPHPPTPHSPSAGLIDTPATPVYVVSQALMNCVVGFDIHRGVLAVGIRPEPRTLDSLLSPARDEVVIVLEDLANHDNLGAIYRNLAGLVGSVGRVLLSPRCADPLYRKSLRVSMGHALRIPTARSTDWPADIERLHAAGYTTLALTPDPEAEDLGQIVRRDARGGESGGALTGGALTGRLALLLGAEGPGLTPGAMRLAGRRLRIPMLDGVDSLNVATAGAITLFCISAVRTRNIPER